MCGGHRRWCERLWNFLLSSLYEKKSDTEIKSWPRQNSNRVPLDPKSQSFQLSHRALDEFRWLKRLFVVGFFFYMDPWTISSAAALKTKKDRLYVFEDSVKSLFWKNAKPIRTCVLGSTSHRILCALPSRGALGCASGTTLGLRAQVSMLGRNSDAASNINVEILGVDLLNFANFADHIISQTIVPANKVTIRKTQR